MAQPRAGDLDIEDLAGMLQECKRRSRCGSVLILEITRPRPKAGVASARFYLKTVVPLIARWGTHSRQVEHIMECYRDPIEGWVPPETILAALRKVGFVNVERGVRGGGLSEYRSKKR
jgi:demethylmenaquinone methyltransferase/2-methoxy-6-polyprenyl-1,4-benzoquinol methylase